MQTDGKLWASGGRGVALERVAEGFTAIYAAAGDCICRLPKTAFSYINPLCSSSREMMQQVQVEEKDLSAMGKSNLFP